MGTECSLSQRRGPQYRPQDPMTQWPLSLQSIHSSRKRPFRGFVFPMRTTMGRLPDFCHPLIFVLGAITTGYDDLPLPQESLLQFPTYLSEYST
jgi:hypothetical protein